MEERLTAVLHQLGFDPAEIRIEATGTGRVGGVVVSDRFTGQTQTERQQWLWGSLRQLMGSAELANIVALLTMTPAEVAED